MTLLAAFLRLHHLDQTPPGLYHDEAFYGLDAQRLLRTGRLVLFFTGNNGREPLHIYLLAGSLFLFGNRTWALRLVSAFSGLLAIPLLYRLGRDLLRDQGGRAEWGGLLAAAALAVSYWHLSFSRIAFRAIHLVPASILVVWLFWRGWQKKSYRLFALSGLALGASLYTYLSARFLPLVFLGFVLIEMLLMWVVDRIRLGSLLHRRDVLGSVLAACVAVLVFAPLGIFFFTHPGTFIQRSQSLSIFNPSVGPQGAPPSTLGQNVATVARMFVDRGDLLARHNLPGRPALDVVGQIGFFAGLVISIIRIRRPRAVLLLLWLGIMLLPTVLSIEAPHFLRAIGALPPMCFLVADGLTWLWERLVRAAPRLSPVAWPALFVGVTLISGGLTYRDYFITWAHSPGIANAFNVPNDTFAQRALALSASSDVALPLEAYSQPTVLFVLEPIFGGLTPIETRAQNRPVIFLEPEGAELRSLVVLHQAPGERAVAYVTRPLEPDVSQELQQRPGDRVLTDSFGRPVAKEVSGVDDMLPTSSAPEHMAGVTFADTIRLAGYDLQPSVVTPGDVLQLVLYWESLKWPPDDYKVFVQMMSPTGDKFTQTDTQPLAGAYPTTLWHPGDIVPDTYTVTVPAGVQPGKYRFEVGLYRQGNGNRLSAVGPVGPPVDYALVGNITVPDQALDPQAIANHTDVSAGDPPIIKLLGYDLTSNSIAPGGVLNLVLYWQALGPIDRDYTVFVHLLDGTGQLHAQQDVQPLDGRAPTSWWSAGEVLRDVHQVSVGTEVSPGAYTLSVGLYYWATGERLPMFDGAGQRLPDDRVLLPVPITVKENNP